VAAVNADPRNVNADKAWIQPIEAKLLKYERYCFTLALDGRRLGLEKHLDDADESASRRRRGVAGKQVGTFPSYLARAASTSFDLPK
jgi:hypothetical protein